MTHQSAARSRLRNSLVAIGIASIAGGCASVPDVTVAYLLPRSSSQISVTQVIECNSAKTELLVTNSPTVATVYSADPTKRHTVRIRDIEGGATLFADSDTSISLYDDGRLKGINSVTTGQAEAFIKSAIQLGAILGTQRFAPAGALSTISECDDILAWGDKLPVTLVYTARVNSVKQQKSTGPLVPTPGSLARYQKLKQYLPEFEYELGALVEDPLRVEPPTAKEGVPLTLLRTGAVPVRLIAKAEGKTDVILEGSVVVPGENLYELPIPKAAAFGKQAFTLGLAESGAITSVSYGKTAGSQSALNAVNSVIDTSGAEAAAIKAQADLLAAQARLAKCLANPTTCS